MRQWRVVIIHIFCRGCLARGGRGHAAGRSEGLPVRKGSRGRAHTQLVCPALRCIALYCSLSPLFFSLLLLLKLAQGPRKGGEGKGRERRGGRGGQGKREGWGSQRFNRNPRQKFVSFLYCQLFSRCCRVCVCGRGSHVENVGRSRFVYYSQCIIIPGPVGGGKGGRHFFAACALKLSTSALIRGEGKREEHSWRAVR